MRNGCLLLLELCLISASTAWGQQGDESGRWIDPEPAEVMGKAFAVAEEISIDDAMDNSTLNADESPVFANGFETSLTLVTDDGREQKAAFDHTGGILEVADSQGTVVTLSVPAGGFIGAGTLEVEAVPLASATVLPTGQRALAGVKWSYNPDQLLGGANAQIFSAEAGQFGNLAGFVSDSKGRNFYFVPLELQVEGGAVLNIAGAAEGAVGIASVPVEVMESWPAPIEPPEARFLQRIAVVLKNNSSSLKAQSTSIVENCLQTLTDWYEAEVKPELDAGVSGCQSAVELTTTTSGWLGAVQLCGLEEHPDLVESIQAVESSLTSMYNKSEEDLQAINQECSATDDPCELMQLLEDAAQCAQTMQFAGFDSPNDPVCVNAPARLEVTPRSPTSCVGDAIAFTAEVHNLNGAVLPLPTIKWTSRNDALLSVDPDSGAAEALAVGDAYVDLVTDYCPNGTELHATAVVRIRDVPDTVGFWDGRGSERVWGCVDPLDNGIYGNAGTAQVTSQSPTGEEGVESFAGSGSGLRLGETFSGTVRCGGLVDGTGAYTEFDPCPPETCVTTGVSTFTGRLIGDTVKFDTTAQDTGGDTCTSEGWATMTKRAQ